ncbi:MAG: alpha/beta hydrolase [Chloroflexi bacterium]|nr:alpha/beta hydrolase [Chloroflexota bacterium]
MIQPPVPDRVVASTDGTAIAVFESGIAPAEAEAAGVAPLILVHGTTSDHLTFRVVAPMLGRRRRLFAIDRRGRGASGDRPEAYAIAREFEDVAAVAAAVSASAGGVAVDVVGHSFGGRCALGAALLTPAIRRVVSYEGAPPRDAGPDAAYEPDWLLGALRTDLRRGDLEGLLERFMRTVVGMNNEGVARFRADPVWPLRVAAAPTILRELDASSDPAAGLDALARVERPVLQVLGSVSPAAFGANTRALTARLADAELVVIDGAAHAAHHTHPAAFVAAVEGFLDRPPGAS